jgi:hypothetical protein
MARGEQRQDRDRQRSVERYGDATDDPGGRRAIGDFTAEHWVSVPLCTGP